MSSVDGSRAEDVEGKVKKIVREYLLNTCFKNKSNCLE